MQLEVSQDELSILEELLGSASKKLPIEIHHTFHGEFKSFLRDKQKRIEDLLEKVKKAK